MGGLANPSMDSSSKTYLFFMTKRRGAGELGLMAQPLEVEKKGSMRMAEGVEVLCQQRGHSGGGRDGKATGK